ncbi:MAG: DNA-binding protein [Calditrichaeota bacterium]|nr:MAG: DNA-binding protein [Calditrichota bacterium]MBL1204558.1 DNA-binding protein [Calditrichota bacterium]NOG44386.1 DNA-binding protein [Calditrichota bacterium]
MSIKYKVVPRKNPLKPADPPRYYAQAVIGEKKSLNDLATRIAKSTLASKTDVHAVLLALTDEIVGYLQEGHAVDLGELCTFYPSLKSASADTADTFNAVSQITSKKVNVKTRSGMSNILTETPVMKISSN